MKIILIIYILLILFCQSALAGQIPKGQDAGSALRNYADRKTDKKRIKRINEESYNPLPAIDAPKLKTLPGDQEFIYIKDIAIQKDRNVKVYIDYVRFEEITSDNINKNLTLENMESIVGLIIDEYQNDALEAYIPDQSFDDNILYINLISRT